jgi:hypothetical protein
MVLRTNAPCSRGATRRGLLMLALAAPATAYAARAAAATGACVDLDTLPSGQKSMRQSLNFKLVSDDSRRCSGCAFFSATDGDCGKCQILGGPTPAQARCDSWAARK